MNNRTVTVDQEPFECVPHWLLMDPNLTANALRVYLVLRKHRDYQTTECHPGRKKIAELASMSIKSVDRAVALLQDMGAITVTPRRREDGSPTSNLYHVHWEQGGGVKNDPTLATETTLGVATETTHEQRPIFNEDPMNEVKTPSTTHFDEFWKAYPRKKDKGHARKAWDKAVKTTNSAVIVAAAVQFRQWCDQEENEARFIPYPATWLNGERWLDERDPVPPTRLDGWVSLLAETMDNSPQGYPQLEG